MSTVGPVGPPALPAGSTGAGTGPATVSAERPIAGQGTPAGAGAPVPSGPATLRIPGPWLPATLLPGGAAGPGLAVELRLATASATAASLLGRVLGGGSGLVLDQGGHLLTLTPRLAALPEGARLPIELRVPATGTVIDNRDGLERLVRPNAAPPPPLPVAPGAGLAARLLVEWRRAENAGRPDQPAEVSGRPAAPAEAASGWRSLFDLAGAGSVPVAPVLLWQHRPAPEDPAGEAEAEHLRLVVELSRLGRVAIDLRVDAVSLTTSITSAEPLERELRAGIGEVYAAAVELAGRSGSLAFRVMPAASAVAPAPGPIDGLII